MIFIDSDPQMIAQKQRHTLILGNPGVGKSSFGYWYIAKLLTDPNVAGKYDTIVYKFGDSVAISIKVNK